MNMRYIIGVPYLYWLGTIGESVMAYAIVIGLICGLTDHFLLGR
jgi:hypothetical protein